MRFRFRDCVFDADTREVLRAGRPVAVSPKAFELLELLIGARPAAVAREDLHARLWPKDRVSDASLRNLVVELRSALRDDSSRRRVIRTVPRFGYAFVAPAQAERRGAAQDDAAGTPDLVYRLIWGRREIALPPGECVIGRDRDVVLWIDDESVSRRHARISVGRGAATLEDLNSKNGVFVGGRKISGPVPLADGDVLKIGFATMVVRVVDREGSTRSASRKRPKRELGSRGGGTTSSRAGALSSRTTRR
jgi:DNA-binding winged helix-turn-helix (wHTH) protein